MEKKSIPISFTVEDIQYTGWATPSDRKHTDGSPASYHVVLNETFFGDMSLNDGHWISSEHRPSQLVAAAGKALSRTIF